MKTVAWVLKTEFSQNRLHLFFIFMVSLLLGASIKLSIDASNKIESLTQHVNWDADLIILPKGVTLNDFKEELLTAKTSAFLPEALFDTTISLARDSFKLSAVLAITDQEGSRVQIKNNHENLGINWLKGRQNIASWKDQSVYSTPEWGYKVISGFFATGPQLAMENLKDLINKRTVAQALFVSQQQQRDEKNQSELRAGLFLYAGVLVVLIILSLLSLFFWIRIRVTNSLDMFEELGVSNKFKFVTVSYLFAMSCAFPISLGLILIYLFGSI